MTRLLCVDDFFSLVQVLGQDLRVTQSLLFCDICAGWKLHSVNNAMITSLHSTALLSPRIRHGCVSVVLYNYGCSTCLVDSQSVKAATLFYNAISVSTFIPLQFAPHSSGLAAADAWADAEHAGLGGWWLPDGAPVDAAEIHWFSVQLTRKSLPSWFRAEGSASLQACIAALEAVAQLILLVLRRRHAQLLSSTVTVQFRQLCDNAGVTAASVKSMSQKEPLSFVLQALGYYCCKWNLTLHCSHIAGERNVWADRLSRNEIPAGVDLRKRCFVDIMEVLQLPWK